MSLFTNPLQKYFKKDSPTETVTFGDLDIVKLSAMSWSQRHEIGVSKKFLATTWCLAVVVVFVQTVILWWLWQDVTDIMFCGDVVRHINSGEGSLLQFFSDNGTDTHSSYQQLWDSQYSKEATDEIKFERERLYLADYEPSCQSDSANSLQAQKRLKLYSDENCTQELRDSTSTDYKMGLALASLVYSNKECKETPIPGLEELGASSFFYTQCRPETYTQLVGQKCKAINVQESGEQINPILLLTKAEKQEYFEMRCLDKKNKLFLDPNVFAHLVSGSLTIEPCSLCCFDFIKSMQSQSGSGFENYRLMDMSEDNFKLVASQEIKANQWLKERLTHGAKLEKGQQFELSSISKKLNISNTDYELTKARFDYVYFNQTFKYDDCQKQIAQFGPNPIYQKYSKPKEPFAVPQMKKAYEYDFEFENKQIYTMTWTRKKIQFINDLAKKWGGKIAEASTDQCSAPIDSTDTEVISLCQNLTVDAIMGEKDTITRLKNQFHDKSQRALDKLQGILKSWDDSILQEYIDNIQNECNRTQTQKQFTCDPSFRSEEGTCLIKWECNLAEWAGSICGDIEYIQYASKVPRKNVWFWIVAMVVLSFSLTNDCCEHLLYMRAASFPWKLKMMLQILISINICFMNAILCAGQGTGFDMIMNSLALMALNDIDNIIASLFNVLSGINLDDIEVTILDRHDYHFSKFFAIPHMVWVLFYSLCFLGIIPIRDPPEFVREIQLIQSFGFIGLLIIWYFISYSAWFERMFYPEEEGSQKGEDDQKQEDQDVEKESKGEKPVDDSKSKLVQNELGSIKPFPVGIPDDSVEVKLQVDETADQKRPSVFPDINQKN